MSRAVKDIRFGVIGCGLMGREFAAAAARWCQLDSGAGVDFRPVIRGVCDLSVPARDWFVRNLPGVAYSTDRYQDLLEANDIDALYIAVPHDLHARFYVDAIEAGKALMGEKPFGIDHEANALINAAIEKHPEVLVRCSSEMPFFPGAQRLVAMAASGQMGHILEVESGFWHSSDLDFDKPINWKRQIKHCGEYGCLGDLGMHALHVPLRLGWYPSDVRAILSNIVTDRPDARGSGERVACETWDNGTMFCRVQLDGQDFPMTVSTKRIAPGHQNTWVLRIIGTRSSAEFSTKNPKQFRHLPYPPVNGKAQAWHVEDVPFAPPYPMTAGSIFEFGFCDAILQMWAAFCDEFVHGPGQLRQSGSPAFGCVTPDEARQHHEVLTAAVASQATGQTVSPVGVSRLRESVA